MRMWNNIVLNEAKKLPHAWSGKTMWGVAENLAKTWIAEDIINKKLWNMRYGDIVEKKWTRKRLERYAHQGLVLEDGKNGGLTAYIRISIVNILQGTVAKPSCFNDFQHNYNKMGPHVIQASSRNSFVLAPSESIPIPKDIRLGCLKTYFNDKLNAKVLQITDPIMKKIIFLHMCDIWHPSTRFLGMGCNRWEALREITFE